MIIPSFIYFRKLKHPSHVQLHAGDIYELTVVYDYRNPLELWRTKHVSAGRCHIAMSGDGTLKLLKEYVSVDVKVQPARRGKGHHKPKALTMRSQQWQFPAWISSISGEHDRRPDEWATHTLGMALLTYNDSTSRIVIRAKKHGIVAAFGIDVYRAKYFFADRDSTALAADGKRKRIFHSVRAHTRVTAVGTSQVKHHYRGIRAFDWNGHAIRIVMPKNNYILEFDKPAVYADDIPKKKQTEYINGAEVGDMLGPVLDS